MLGNPRREPGMDSSFFFFFSYFYFLLSLVTLFERFIRGGPALPARCHPGHTCNAAWRCVELAPRCSEEVSFLNAYANQVEAILIIL